VHNSVGKPFISLGKGCNGTRLQTISASVCETVLRCTAAIQQEINLMSVCCRGCSAHALRKLTQSLRLKENKGAMATSGMREASWPADSATRKLGCQFASVDLLATGHRCGRRRCCHGEHVWTATSLFHLHSAVAPPRSGHPRRLGWAPRPRLSCWLGPPTCPPLGAPALPPPAVVALGWGAPAHPAGCPQG